MYIYTRKSFEKYGEIRNKKWWTQDTGLFEVPPWTWS